MKYKRGASVACYTAHVYNTHALATRESEGAPASPTLVSFLQIPPLSACDNSNLNESIDGLRVHRSNTLPGGNDFETGDIQKNACQLPTIIFGNMGMSLKENHGL